MLLGQATVPSLPSRSFQATRDRGPFVLAADFRGEATQDLTLSDDVGGSVAIFTWRLTDLSAPSAIPGIK